MSTASMRIGKFKTQQRGQAPYRLAGNQGRLSQGPVGPRHCPALWRQRQRHLPARPRQRMVQGPVGGSAHPCRRPAQQRSVRLAGYRTGATTRPGRQAARPARSSHRRSSISWRRGHGVAGEPGGLAPQALSDHRKNHQHGKPDGRGGWAHGCAAERAGS